MYRHKTDHTRLLADVRQLKLDLEQMAAIHSDREKGAFYDAAGMVKNIIEQHERNH